MQKIFEFFGSQKEATKLQKNNFTCLKLIFNKALN